MVVYSGFFVTLEGGEGTGKTTILAKLVDVLQQKEYHVIGTREPGGTKLSEQIRQCVLSRETGVAIGARAELLLYLAARAQHVEERIIPDLENGTIVICDRFNDSSVAYQGVARALGFEDVEKLCDFSSSGLVPNLTILFDIEPEQGIQRVRSLDRLDSEPLHFHEEVRKGYNRLASQYPERIVVIDASLPLEEVFQQSLQVIEEKIKEKKNNAQSRR